MSETPEKNRNLGKLILAGVLLVVALIFVFSNRDEATLNIFGLAELTMPGWLWFVVLLVIGVVIGSLFPWFRPKKK